MLVSDLPAEVQTQIGETPGSERFISDGDLNIGNLLTSYRGLEGKLGGAINLPKDGEAGYDEAMGGIYAKLGRPEKAEDYEITKPDLPKGMTYDDAYEKEFRGIAHKLGMSKKQTAGMADWNNGYQQEKLKVDTETVRKQGDETQAALREEWGANYDKKAGSVKAAYKALFGDDPEVLDYLTSIGLANRPGFIRAMALAGENIGEGRMSGGGSSSGGGDAAAEIRAKINEVRGDRKHPYYNPRLPGHKEARSMMIDLYRQEDAAIKAEQAAAAQ